MGNKVVGVTPDATTFLWLGSQPVPCPVITSLKPLLILSMRVPDGFHVATGLQVLFWVVTS